MPLRAGIAVRPLLFRLLSVAVIALGEFFDGIRGGWPPLCALRVAEDRTRSVFWRTDVDGLLNAAMRSLSFEFLYDGHLALYFSLIILRYRVD